MFTDQPVTPLRLEILVDVVDELGASGTLRREALLEMLQPETLPDFNSEAGEPRSAAKQALKAATDLGLVVEEEGVLRLGEAARSTRRRSARELVLAALDARVLAAVDIETYFAPFYAFILALDTSARSPADAQEWANRYNAAVYGGAAPRNPLNKDKVRGLFRWYPYAGLGWVDPGNMFQCDPTERLARAIPQIFDDVTELSGDEFMMRLGEVCPELDGGEHFRFANGARAARGKALTAGVAQALVGLHLDGAIVLYCPPDSPGWDLSLAAPPNDGNTLRSHRLDAVAWRPSTRQRAASRRRAAP